MAFALGHLVVDLLLEGQLPLILGGVVIAAEEIEPPEGRALLHDVAQLAPEDLAPFLEARIAVLKDYAAFERKARQIGAVVVFVDVELAVQRDGIDGILIGAYAGKEAAVAIGRGRIEHIDVRAAPGLLIGVGVPVDLVVHVGVAVEQAERLFVRQRFLRLGGEEADQIGDGV